MIGWLLVLSFLLGFGLTLLYMVRSVTRTVEVISSPRTRRVPQPVGGPIEGGDVGPGGSTSARAAGRSRVVPQVIEFEEGTEEFYER